MAKWGEGDPRWIVEERADAKNVNNWHWTEKNATQWSKDKLHQLLVGYRLKDSTFDFKVTEVSKCDGEATANNRKAKLIFFYEWVMTLEWEASFAADSANRTKYKGKVEVLNLSEENSTDEVDMEVTCSSSSTEASHRIKELVRTVAVPQLQQRLGDYVHQLQTQFCKDLILPTKNNKGDSKAATAAGAAAATTPPAVVKTATQQQQQPKQQQQKPSSNDKPQQQQQQQQSFKKLTFKEEFFCAPEDLFRVFTQQELVSAFVRSQANVDARIGGQFSYCDGAISGFFDELVPPLKLVMRWRHKKWPAEHYSICTLSFEPSAGGTQLQLVQQRVPDSEVEFTRNSWRQHYFHAIKQTFGYGGKMF